MTVPSGLVVVDKPPGWTSHDVVARVRKLAGTKRVGHAGTLDPMATGVLVLGVGRATRLLGHLTLSTKAYDGTIRLGRRTVTDDAEGEVVDDPAPARAADVSELAVRHAASDFVGEIAQVPPQYSAVKIAGVRSYKRARQGEQTELAPRRVTVHDFDVRDTRRHDDLLDVDVSISCSSGTYVRALARDLGEKLGTGGHLTMLRRTRVGPYVVADARGLDQLAESFTVLALEDAVAAAFPRRDVSAEQARRVAHGSRLPVAGLGPGPVGVFGPDGALLALMEDNDGAAKPLAVFAT